MLPARGRSWYAWRMRTGRCLCGSVTYEIEGDPIGVGHCHCVDCQRFSGAGHTTGAMFPADKIQVRGDVSEFQLQSEVGSTSTRSFCPKCGSSLFGRNSRMAGFVTVAAGTLDDPDGLRPQLAVFTRTRRDWDAMDVAVPSVDALPDWMPGDEL